MKVLKMVLIACSLCALVAHAQTAPAAAEQQVAEADAQLAAAAAQGQTAAPKTKAEPCVGPVSFCSLYFGS